MEIERKNICQDSRGGHLNEIIHMKLVDWPLLILGIKQIYETGPMYKSCVYIHLHQLNHQ